MTVKAATMLVSFVCASMCWQGCSLGQTYSASIEFSPTSNPAGVWSYGLRPGEPGTFEPFTHTLLIDSMDFWDRDLPFPASYPKIGHNGTAQTRYWGGPGDPVAPGELVLHPGVGLGAVLRFTAPSTNRYTVFAQGRVTSTCASATGVSIWADSTPLGSGALGGSGSNVSLDASSYRLAGQTIDLVLTDGGNGINCDQVGIIMIVTASPCGPADVGGPGGVPGPDGSLDNNDFIAFIDLFFASDPLADRGQAGGEPGSDGEFDNNDFIVYIGQFFGGC